LSVVASGVVIIINMALRVVVRQFTLNEKHDTLTNHNLSVAVKLTFARFLNSAILPIIVNIDRTRWFVDGGLASDILYIILSISFLDPILYYFDIPYIVRLLKRFC